MVNATRLYSSIASPPYFETLFSLFLLWIFAGIMGKMIPVFYIPIVQSVRPHFFIASAMTAVAAVGLLYGKYRSIRMDSFNFVSLVAWFGFIGVSAVSFINLNPIQVFAYPRPSGTDSLFVKWAFLIMLMILFIHFYHAARVDRNMTARIVNVVDKSFIAYFFVGWLLYLAVVLGKISRETYFLFTLEFQVAEQITLLRFCPGDYPNGAGEMLAFYIIFLVCMRRYIKYLPLKFLVGTGSLILTTTRAGILPAFTVVGLFCFYTFIKKISASHVLKLSRKAFVGLIALAIGLVLVAFAAKNISAVAQRMSILYIGIVNISESKSAIERVERWDESLKVFSDTIYMGEGFGRFLETHNVIFQLLAEVGIGGTFFFIIFVLLRVAATVNVYVHSSYGKKGIEADFIRMLIAAIPANAFFALTNHNIFHFTFWFLAISTFMVEAQQERRRMPDKLLTASD